MKIKQSTIVFVTIIIAFVFNSCATIPVRKPLPEKFGDAAQIPGIPRAKFWGDEIPPFFGSVIGQSQEKFKQSFPGIYGREHNYIVRFRVTDVGEASEPSG